MSPWLVAQAATIAGLGPGGDVFRGERSAVAYWIASLLMVLVDGYLVYLGWKVPGTRARPGGPLLPGSNVNEPNNHIFLWVTLPGAA